MQNGIFKGTENGMMKIEYACRVIEGTNGPDENGHWGKIHIETRTFEYPYGNRSMPHRDTNFHFGPDKARGWPHDQLPEVGQEVAYTTPSPDTAGHLMVDVYPAGRFSAVYGGETKVEPRSMTRGVRKYVLLQNVVGDIGSRNHAWVEWFPGTPGEKITFIGLLQEDGHIAYVKGVA
jgi:hypothetical protein